MSDIKVVRDSKLIKVLAAQARRERVDSGDAEQAAAIINELAQDLSPANRHEIAQTVAFTVQDLQEHELDFLNRVADIKNVGYGERAMFNTKLGHVKAFIQAKGGSTTARSMIGAKQVEVTTKEISARPAINIMDIRANRVNMADMIREANTVMTNMKLKEIQGVLNDAIDNYNTPFYATGTGIVKATLDGQIQYFRRHGGVTLFGDPAAIQQLAPLTGMAMTTTQTQFSNELINEHNNNGFIGRYMGCDVIEMTNACDVGTTTPVLATDWIYILANGATGDARNLKVVNEGGINAFEAQDINDLVMEIRLDQAFGAGFVVGEFPTIGAYKIGV